MNSSHRSLRIAHSACVSFRWLFVFFFVAGAISLFSPALHAQTWPQEKGYTYLRFGLNGFRGDGYFGSSGSEIALQRLEENTWKFYSEYGYSRYVTGIVSVPAFRTLLVQEVADGPVHRVEAPGDIELGLRLGVYPGEDDVILLTGMFGIPIGETASNEGLWSGDDEYDQSVMLGYGHHFREISTRLTLQGGYHFRSEGYSDEVFFRGELMVKPFSYLQLFFHVRTLESQENGDPEFLGGGYGFASNDQRFVMFGPEIALWITHGFGLRASVFQTTDARNMPSALMFSTGMFLSVAPGRNH